MTGCIVCDSETVSGTLHVRADDGGETKGKLCIVHLDRIEEMVGQ